jgi:ubiquinone/menaquinone biosynthesis C-methylase UbiE
MSHSIHHRSHGHGSVPATRGRTIRWARWYDATVKLLMMNRDGALREETLDLAGIQPGQTVLDVGCGTGDLTLRAKRRAGQSGVVYGIDAAPEMIEVAQRKAVRRRIDVQFRVGVIEALDFPDGTFDVVLSSLMFHHLPEDLKAKGLAQIHRVLKPGGKVLIVDMNRPSQRTRHAHLIHRLHAGLTHGVHDVVPVMQGIGYVHIEAGNLRFKALGYLRAQRGA